MSGQILLPAACATRIWIHQHHADAHQIPFACERITRGREISYLRRHCKLTQRQLADLLGTSESTVVRLEGNRLPIDTRWSSHLTLLFAWLTKRASAQ